eukprot:1061942-Rhodomonas_salina.6
MRVYGATLAPTDTPRTDTWVWCYASGLRGSSTPSGPMLIEGTTYPILLCRRYLMSGIKLPPTLSSYAVAMPCPVLSYPVRITLRLCCAMPGTELVYGAATRPRSNVV